MSGRAFATRDFNSILYSPQGPLHVVANFDFAAHRRAYPVYAVDCLRLADCGYHAVDRLKVNVENLIHLNFNVSYFHHSSAINTLNQAKHSAHYTLHYYNDILTENDDCIGILYK